MIKRELKKAMFAIIRLGRTSRIVEMRRFWTTNDIQRLRRCIVRSRRDACSTQAILNYFFLELFIAEMNHKNIKQVKWI